MKAKTFCFNGNKDNYGPLDFTPDDVEITELKPNIYGSGSVKYKEGSIYTGRLYYDGVHFNKIGYGEQDFTHSIISADEVGGPIDSKLYKYIGNYDYRITDWIYGNGVFYFLDQINSPLAFIKGFFSGTRKEKEYQGVFDEHCLIEGYTLSMEVECLPHRKLVTSYQEQIKDVKQLKTLLIGDSWFELLNNLKVDDVQDKFKNNDVLNLGIGGSTYLEWIPLLPQLVYPVNPSKIIINLGFNDIHYSNNIDKTFNDFVEVTSNIHLSLPSTRIYLLAVSPSPSCQSTYSLEQIYNHKVKEYCRLNYDYLIYLNVDTLFIKDGKQLGNLHDYFVEDGYHLNNDGYKIWFHYFEDVINESRRKAYEEN